MKRILKQMALPAVLLVAAPGAADVQSGYNLYSPIQSTTTYLMDNDGEVVHSWASSMTPGLAVYLLEDGTLMRTAKSSNTMFEVGGAGGTVEQYDWEGVLLWSFEYNTSAHRLHHDIEVLPNGNVLMIAWESKTETEALAAGRDPTLLRQGELWPDHVIEVAAAPGSDGTVVWEWHIWDHLVQDYDASKDNYGSVADHPELIDLNHAMNPGADWTHINAIDYNPDLDQIVLSVRNFSEIWIIDHSTTTAQAAGHSGGTSGRGGDLLYRWGNPQAWGGGSASDQQLWVQHDAEWIEAGRPGAGNILVFNNGAGRPAGDYSSVDEIVPPLLPDGSYDVGAGWSPAAPVWSYVAEPVTDFYDERVSGAQRLANGNTLICSGVGGRFFEVDDTGAVLWEYEYGGDVFRVDRYGEDYPGLGFDDGFDVPILSDGFESGDFVAWSAWSE